MCSESAGVYVKVQEAPGDRGEVREVVGVCDKELLGAVLEDGGVKLIVNKEFFGGFEASVEEALEYVRNAFTAMMVGERIVKAAIKEGLIHGEAVMVVKGVPYAQLARM